MPWEDPPTGDYIRSGHGSVGEDCKTIDIDTSKGIKAIYCKYGDKWKIQSYLFDKRKPHNWTMDRAKKWFSDHAEAQTKQVEEKLNRHPDFQRIYDEHVKYYCKGSTVCSEADKAYNDWLKLLDLDETRPYGEKFEAFRFAKDIIKLAREDKENKYYKVLMGFPLKSMNGNVYTEQELKQAVATIPGIVPNINHYDDYLLEDKEAGLKAEFVEAAYEDGAAEAVLKVPKALKCPDCSKGTTICHLIDNNFIVNVSLEASCSREGVCNNMRFTGCGLLTAKQVDGSPHKKTLPGIPLARIYPLEAIAKEAFKVVKDGKPVKRKPRIEIIGLGSTEEQFRYAPMNQDSVIYPDAKGQCPQGWAFTPALNECLPVDCPKGFVLDGTRGECIPIPKGIPEGTKVVLGVMVPDDSHKPIEGNKPVKVPKPTDQEKAKQDMENSTLLLRAIRAENVAKSLEEQIATLEKLLAEKISENLEKKGEIKGLAEERERLLEAEKRHLKEMEGKDERFTKHMKEHTDQIETLIKQHNERVLEIEKDMVALRNEIEALTKSRDKYKTDFETLQTELKEITDKYNEKLAENLELTKRVTTLNEEIIQITRESNETKEKLRDVNKNARKIITVTT